MKSKIDFTKDKLKAIVLELANLQGYQNPSTYLDELLNEVKQFNSFEFECDFFLNIHYLCKENSEKFWSEAHRKDITQWLGKARILTDVFKTTWDGLTKDTRYSLAKFYKNLPKAKYEMMKRQIEKDGYFIVREENKKNDIKIYTTELAFVFLSNEITVDNLDTKTETKIKSWEYFKTYIESYKEGEQYFENEFKVSPNIIYGANAKEYVEGIHKNYFYVQHIAGFDGWGYVKKHYPIYLTHNAVKELGYYSGIVNKVEEQKKKYPVQFATFDKCEHSTPPQQAETKSDKLKVKQIAIIHVYEGLQITRGNAGEIASKHGYTAKNSGEGLFQDYTHYCNTSNRIGKPTPCTPKKLKNKIELFESVVNHLTDSNKKRAIDEINILNTIFDNEYR